ncbi:MAG: alpha/beta fold hydrolase [Planctomycetes bacterium]|nr:alpha/beta fold hydrolase [Planctomycetota bacterium]
MLHGNPTWSFYYRNLIAALAPRYRCIAPDHIGCGLSDKPDDSRYSYTLSRRVDDLDALIEHLGLRQDLTLVLHDWGGMIGMAWADRRPERVRRLVFLNTAAFHLPPTTPFPWPLWFARPALGSLLIRGANAFSAIAARTSCTRHPLSPELRAAYCAPYDSWAHRIATLRFVQDIPLRPADPGYDLVSRVAAGLARFRDRPALLLWGMKDFVFDGSFLDAWIGHLPQAEVHRFADCGHYILEDAGAEAVELIRRFLESHPLSGARP